MAIDILMPPLSQTSDTLVLTAWLKKVGEAEDIAAMAEFLLSEKARWITGQIMHVDGGMGAIKM